ncbi:MAG: hypothetical protein ACRDDH_03970, partial [Cetobacterium sp.]|uniref:hypothetical protein n=1 Tax=Cetobacterium sp. TaxID=2071632 RepID=UPI003EE795E7
MDLKEKYYDRKGFKREASLESMRANPELKIGNIVKVAETGYFYDIKNTSTSIPLNNGLFAEVKQTTFLQIVINCINNLTNLTSLFNRHKTTIATQSQDGHISKEDKAKIDNLIPNNGVAGKILVNNGNGTSKWDNEVPTLRVGQTFSISGYEIGVEP